MAILDLVKLMMVLVLFEGLLGDKTSTDESGGTKAHNCDKEFRSKGYIPKYAKGLKTTALEVLYENKKIECGDTVSLLQAAHAPTLKFDLTEKCVNVTLLTFAPDSINAPPFLTWLVHNIPAEAMKEGYTNDGIVVDIEDGDKPGNIKSSYLIPKDVTGGSGVRNNSQVFFVYCQCRYIDVQTTYQLTDRFEFDIKGYIKDNGMGCPVAGFFHLFSPTGLTLPTVVKAPDLSVPSLVKLPKPILPGNLPTD